MKDISKDFQGKLEYFLLINFESVEVIMLVYRVLELVHIHFRDISSDGEIMLYMENHVSPILVNKTKLGSWCFVSKGDRFDIRKYNGRIARGFSPREPTFQVTLDAIALTPCYPAFLITADVPEVLGHTGDITSLNDVVVDQMHQPWRTFAALINRSLSGKTSGFLTSFVSPEATNHLGIKKASPTKKDSDLVPVDEEPVTKGKQIKRSVKKSSTKLAIRIELLSEVALTKKAQLKEVRKKRLRDFHKTHPSSSEDDSTESESESWGNDEDDSNNEQEASDEGSRQENESKEQESDSEQDEESDDDNQEEEEVDQENESEEMDD
ncbi:hypothetical protein Tco_0070870 [Tanacetum coccineum]